MATFKIHEDAEKENPPMQHPLREKLGSIGEQRKLITAPLGATTAVGKLCADRPNFATLNNSKNVKYGPGRVKTVFPGSSGVVIMQPKMAFREVSNVKSNEGGHNGVAKKASAPVDQAKMFTVYEDHKAEQQRQSQQLQQSQQQISISATTTTTTAHFVTASIEIDKENVFAQQQRNVDIEIESSMERNISVTSGDYTIDGTPMSISDIPSPMSIDRSNIEKPIIDDSNDASSVIKKTAKNDVNKFPRNDRQRFFEVVDYQRDILQYFRDSEQKHRPKPHYMTRQTDINHTMRTILVDWLVEVSEEYNLDTETLYLAVFYIDRFLSHMSVVRSKLQLVGTAAMYIAAKYEEIYPPDVSEFVFITDDTYTKSQVLRMEQIILKILTFDLCTPTSYAYLNTYAVMIDMPDNVKMLAQYLSELSLLEADPFLYFLPSQISSGAVALARYNLELPIWSPELEDITNYTLEELKDVILQLAKLHNSVEQMVSQQAIPEKYKADRYLKVSTLAPAELKEDKFNELLAEYNKTLTENAANAAANSSATPNSKNVRKMISLMFN